MFGMAVIHSGSAQTADSTALNTDKNIRNKVLNDIQESLDKKSKTIDLTLTRVDSKVDSLDIEIAASRDARDKVDKLVLRVQALEKKQQAIEENELNVYQANYQSAIINLVSMDKEIKPLVLFNATKSFFATLGETADPMNYPGYQDWYKRFYAYIEKEKDHDPALDVLHDMVTVTGNITGSKLSQFDYDKDLVEQQWEIVTKELEKLQIHYDTILNQNLALLNMKPQEYQRRYDRETDADKRYEFLTELRKRASALVTDRKTADVKNWKQPIYYELMDVQSLKLRFGDITFDFRGILSKYNELIAKYRKDPEIGLKVQELEVKLNALNDTFDQAFDPTEYINSATRMYLVN